MSKFFVPTSWENLVDAIKFRPIKTTGADAVAGVSGSGSAAVSGPKINKNKIKKRTIKKAINGSEEDDTAQAPNAPSKPTTNAKTARTAVVQNDYVEKQRKRRKHQLTPALVKAVTSAGDFGEEMGSEKIPKQQTKTRKCRKKTATDTETPEPAVEDDVATEAPAEMDASSEDDEDADEEDDENMPSVPDDVEEEQEQDIGLSVFENKLKERLMGGRFRYINEQLYSMNSRQAEQLFTTERDAFDAYHAGYRQQVRQWPLNPLDRIIKIIRRLPKSLEIADFGCGEARLAKSVPNKVYSMDLVSADPHVIACDMANTPLNEQSVDVVVYCLSLMGTNLTDYLLEANRVLRLYGLLLIAEIQSRFDDLRQFLQGLESCGFELVKKDVSAGLFYFFQFKKVRNVGKVAMLPAFSLKPCLYRKR